MATEYLQFAGALVFFLAILIGSYWFVYVPQSRQSNKDRQLNEEKRL
jgi:cbb3-type cytochrome oxidase subunit 3